MKKLERLECVWSTWKFNRTLNSSGVDLAWYKQLVSMTNIALRIPPLRLGTCEHFMLDIKEILGVWCPGCNDLDSSAHVPQVAESVPSKAPECSRFPANCVHTRPLTHI